MSKNEGDNIKGPEQHHRSARPLEPKEGPRDTVTAGLAGRLQPQELDRLDILQHVSIEAVWGIFEHCIIHTLRSGEVLLTAGQANQIMYMILEGKLSVHLEAVNDAPVAFLEAGQTVGEISVIDNSPASAHVVAREETRLLAVDEDTFWRLVDASHNFSKNLLLLLTRRMRANNLAISENVKMKRHFEREANVDALTGLNNRRWLDETMPRLIRRQCRSKEPLSILIIDIDHFKDFNDNYGHAAGDQALSIVSKILINKIRPIDLSARYGGEEFVVILPNAALSSACIVAERLRTTICETSLNIAGRQACPPITISIGVAQLNEDEKMKPFFDRADGALYRAKKNGRNRVEC